MPEVGDLHLHLQGVGDLLLQCSNQGCFSRCYSCGSGVKSEFSNACLDCRELFQDVKPGDVKAPLLVEPFWRAPEDIPLALLASPTVPEDHIALASNRVTRPRSSTSDDSSRDHLVHSRSPRRSPTSPYRTLASQRGRPPNGSRQGPPGFKGVRQRKGVRGYLVEIRPPKWKRTIWLGTYNTDREAAAAYDAGIFYTNKKTKYNFPHLQGTFPPLPSQLRLDNIEDSEEIKTFVQREARLAAQKVKSLPPAESSATSGTSQNGPGAGATSTSSEECLELCETGSSAANATPIVLPLDDEWLFDWPRGYNELHASILFDEMVCNASLQHSGNLAQASIWQMGTTFELKQEEITLDHSLL